MAMFAGEPLPIEETPELQPSALGPSLLAVGNIRYRIGHESMTIYAFEDYSSAEDEPSQVEERGELDDGYDHVDSYGAIPPRGPLDVSPMEREGISRQNLGGSQEGTKGDQGAAGPSAVNSGVVIAPAAKPPLAFWVAHARGAVPRDAVPVSEDLDGGLLFVGRTCVYGELLAGKVAPRHRVCYVASEGRELAFEKYEVLVLKRGRVEWVRGQHGSFPADAFPAGLTLQNQRVYVARARVNNILTPGRLVVGENECRISYDMKEFKFPEYEIMTVRHLEPNENGMVRYISAENIVWARENRSRRESEFPTLCGTSSINDERVDEYDEEEEEEEEDEDEDDDDDDDDDDEDEVERDDEHMFDGIEQFYYIGE